MGKARRLTILGIETSCDETSCAVVVEGRELLSNIVASQVDFHRKFGGVVPEVASRKHTELIISVLDEALRAAGVEASGIDVIGVTCGPGLIGSLLVGVSLAKAMSLALDIPLIGVNHIEGHVYANFLEHPDIEPPMVCLVVSGGHSDLLYLPEHGRFELMGRTRDDAAGEAFDKLARVLGLGYPGGPEIDRVAASGDPEALEFPRAYLEEGSYDFSFSGLKTAVINHLRKARERGDEVSVADVAASLQKAIVDVLVDKAIMAALDKGVGVLAVAGGVASNSFLRRELQRRASPVGLKVVYPSPALCTDNAAMVACAAYYRYMRGDVASLELKAIPNLGL